MHQNPTIKTPGEPSGVCANLRNAAAIVPTSARAIRHGKAGVQMGRAPHPLRHSLYAHADRRALTEFKPTPKDKQRERGAVSAGLSH